MKKSYTKISYLFILLTLAVNSVFAAKSSASVVSKHNNTKNNINTDSDDIDSIILQNTPKDKVKNAPTQDIVSEQNTFISNMLLQSIGLMGIAYKWGGNTPTSGMDCSGFVKYVFKQSLGINLPRTAAEMARVGKKISLNEMKPGDLVFFNTGRGSNTHIGIYLGDDKFIQSPRTGELIQISQLNGYWKSHFNGAKRIIQESVDDDGNPVIEDYSDIHSEALPANYRPKRIVIKNKHKHHVTTKESKTNSSPSSVVVKHHHKSHTVKKHKVSHAKR